MAVTINGTTGIAGVDGSASTPAVQGSDTNTGIAFPAADTVTVATGGSERMRIDSSGIVGVGITPSAWDTSANTKALQVGVGSLWTYAGAQTDLSFNSFYDGTNYKRINADFTSRYAQTEGTHRWFYAASGSAGSTFTWTEAARITSGGAFLVGTTTTSTAGGPILTSAGGFSLNAGYACLAANTRLFDLNRVGDDGVLVAFWQAGTEEGNISVSGTTVSYNGGHLSRWAQTQGPKDDTLLKGTVLSNLDEMNVYTDAEGNPVENEQLNKVKVSDVEGDVNVAGVFVNWSYDDAHQVDEINMAMTGDMIIRIAQGVVVQKGDLLMSAGDGTAKPQGDDIVRSKTVAKVTSNHVTCTYEDGSYCVPCVLMAC